MNYFKVKPDSPLHAKITAMVERVNIYVAACKSIRDKYKADGFVTDDFHFTPACTNLWFRKEPDSFRCRPEHGGWVPMMNTKEGKELSKELQSLDLVRREEFCFLFYNDSWCKPGMFTYKGEYYIEGECIEFLDDLIEILGSTFESTRENARLIKRMKAMESNPPHEKKSPT
jgi:hypothetical protein